MAGRDAVFWRNRTIALFDRVPMPVAFCDSRGVIRTVNPAMAAEWSALPGDLSGKDVLELFQPEGGVHPVEEALRLRRRSRYPVAVSWTAGSGARRRGEMTADLVNDVPDEPPNLLLVLQVHEELPDEPPGVSALEARILALAAGGSTSAQIASAVGLTVDGVNYHFTQLGRRWAVAGKTALVARAYVEGVLDSGEWPPKPT
jgi:DNA-binding CsgD family transcriptional regulator